MQVASSASQSQGRSARPIFSSALILVLVVAVLWLWTSRQTITGQGELTPLRQEALISMVAEDYWRTKDASLATEALSGWEPKDLTLLLIAMEGRAAGTEAREYLTALRQALKTEAAASRKTRERPSVFASLVNQKAILYSVVLAILVLVAALVIALFPLLRSLIPKMPHWGRQTEKPAEVALETPEQRIVAELLASDQLEEGPSLSADPGMYEYLSVVEGGSEEPQPLTELFAVEEAPSSEDKQSVQETAEEGQDAESLMRMFIHMDELVADEDIDIQDVAGSQSILGNLFETKEGEGRQGGLATIFGGVGALDYHLEALIEALGDRLKDIDVHELVTECEAVLERFRKGHAHAPAENRRQAGMD